MLFSYADGLLIFEYEKKWQVWRLFSAHFIHVDFYHLTGNLLAYVMLLYLFPISWQKQLKIFLMALLLIDVYLLFFSIEIYAGLSGLLYAIPGASCYRIFKQKKYISTLFIVLILLVYLGVISPYTSQFYTEAWQPLNQAHLLGFVAGLLGAKLMFEN